MRVGIVGILHESNTFITAETTLEHFSTDTYVYGDDVSKAFADSPHEIGGMLQGLIDEEIDTLPMFAARATPFGPIGENAVETLCGDLVVLTDRAQPLDGLLVALHGAAVGNIEGMGRDFDGMLLASLREMLGENVPLIATLDLHANVSQQMVAAADALIGYRTNPHIDQRERGIEAAQLMARTLRGEVKPTMAAAFPRVAINIEKQLTSEQPCRQLYGMADEMLHEPMVLSNSVLLGFPYADVDKMGSSVVIVTDNEQEVAQQLADQLATHIEDNRHLFAGEFLNVKSAVEQALELEGPVLLLDMGDNVGGGSPGDGTAIAHELLRVAPRNAQANKYFICLNDPLAASRASDLSVRTSLAMGGIVETQQGPPLMRDVDVLQLHDGKFSESGVTHGGITQFDQGPTAIVRTDQGLTIMLTTERVPPFSLRQMTALGLDPSDFQIIVAKGVHAPRAAYDSVCKHCLRVDTPGVTRADMTKLDYQHRRHPLFPFEDWDDSAG